MHVELPARPDIYAELDESSDSSFLYMVFDGPDSPGEVFIDIFRMRPGITSTKCREVILDALKSLNLGADEGGIKVYGRFTGTADGLSLVFKNVRGDLLGWATEYLNNFKLHVGGLVAEVCCPGDREDIPMELVVSTLVRAIRSMRVLLPIVHPGVE